MIHIIIIWNKLKEQLLTSVCYFNFFKTWSTHQQLRYHGDPINPRAAPLVGKILFHIHVLQVMILSYRQTKLG